MAIVVYNSATLNAWQKEAALLNERIPHYRSVLAADNKALHSLQNQIDRIQTDISDLHFAITWAGINQMQDRHYHLRHHYRYHYQPRFYTCVDTSTMNYLDELYAHKGQLYNLKTQYNTQRSNLVDKIASNQRTLSQARVHLAQLEPLIAASQIFLATLKTNPGKLVTQLKEAILTAFKTYAEKHPAGCSIPVRWCLYAIAERLNYLTTTGSADLKSQQLHYLDLCALLQDMHLRVPQEGKDAEFNAVLSALLDETHIANNGDLPDEMQTGQYTFMRVTSITAQNPSLFALTTEQLFTLEEQHYDDKLQVLAGGIFVDEMQKKIQAVITEVEAEIASKKQKNQAIDYHFYAHVFDSMWQAVNHRQDHATIQHLGVLANAAAGNPSIGKKVTGALLAVVGILLVAASVTCLAATFGGSALASGFGVALGLSLIQSQICLGAAASVTAIAGTSLSFWGGSTFKAGMRQGLSKGLMDFKQEIEPAGLKY